jgi:AcrR family transcriptional regulator
VSEAPPYARIAAELRGRVVRGELAPGDRLPSTREITREFGVAIATATKVLAALRAEGLARPVPGVGTVVARSPARSFAGGGPADPAAGPARPRRRVPAGATLSRERIVAAAVAVADAEGLDGVSMRRVATELGAAPMSLYRHVATKDDLLLHMMDAAIGESELPAEPPGDWRARVELVGRRLWAVFRRHPWLAPAMSVTRPQPVPAGLAYTEWVLAALDGFGLDPRTRLDIHITLFTFVRGTAANLELEAAAEAATGLTGDQWLETQEGTIRSLVAGGGYPNLAQVFGSDYDFDLDTIFDLGLGLLLDGLAVRLAASALPAATRAVAARSTPPAPGRRQLP